MAQPLVSVVIPCFNAGRMLRPALRSVVEQTYPHLEIVFVDNNSADGSLDRAREIAAGSPRPFIFASCPEQGVNHARNLGYGFVRGEYVQWFDADDLLAPDKIARQVAMLEREIAIAYFDWFSRQHLPNRPPLEDRHPLTDVADQILRTLALVWYPPHAYLLRRRSRLQAEHAWWPGRRLGTDVEYSAVAALLGLRFRHVPGTAVCYNISSDGQLSGTGTPYPVRAGILRDIYQRLAGLAERPDIRPRVTAPHRTLPQPELGCLGAAARQPRCGAPRPAAIRAAPPGEWPDADSAAARSGGGGKLRAIRRREDDRPSRAAYRSARAGSGRRQAGIHRRRVVSPRGPLVERSAILGIVWRQASVSAPPGSAQDLLV